MDHTLFVLTRLMLFLVATGAVAVLVVFLSGISVAYGPAPHLTTSPSWSWVERVCAYILVGLTCLVFRCLDAVGHRRH